MDHSQRTHSPAACRFRWLAVVLLAAGLVACGDEGEGDDKDAVKCGKTQVVKFDPNTGDKRCVDNPDAGSLGDGASLGDASGDGAGSGDAAKDGKDSNLGVKDSGDDSETPFDAFVPPTCPAGATGDEKWWNCPPTIAQKDGLKHGKGCTKDEECLYGHCMFGLPIVGYDKSIGVCTKNCKYPGGGKLTSCDTDSTVDPDYECVFEKTKSAGNDQRSAENLKAERVYGMCVKFCKTNAECQAWNPATPECFTQSTKYVGIGVYGVCMGSQP